MCRAGCTSKQTVPKVQTVCCNTALMLRCTTLAQPGPCACLQVPACRQVPHQCTCAVLHHSDSVFLLCVTADATPISGSTTGISKILYTRGQCNLGVSALAGLVVGLAS